MVRTRLRVLLVALLVLAVLAVVGTQCARSSASPVGTWTKSGEGLGPTSMTLNQDGSCTAQFSGTNRREFWWEVRDNRLIISSSSGQAISAKFRVSGDTLTLQGPTGDVAYRRVGSQ